jgi:hypothetical protein
VLGSERDTCLLQRLTEVGAQLTVRGGFPTAGCARFEEYAVGDLAPGPP